MKTAKQLTETDTCETCKNTGLMICPNHKAQVDKDGWCTTCDSPDGPKHVTCICQDE